jgi:hypothetical protein
MKDLSTLKWVVIIFSFIVILFIAENQRFIKNPIESYLVFNNISNYAVALGTILLAFHTWRLSVNTISISNRDRVRDKLKYYSHLNGVIITREEKIKENPQRWLNMIFPISNINYEYELYASDELIILLRDYYKGTGYTDYIQNKEAWDKLCANIIKVVKDDFQLLKKMY